MTAGSMLVVGAFAIFGVWHDSIAEMILGILVLDVAVQAAQVANQTTVYTLDADARSRLNTVFMGSMLIGGLSAREQPLWTSRGLAG